MNEQNLSLNKRLLIKGLVRNVLCNDTPFVLNKSLKPELFLRGFLFQIRLQSPILEEFYSARLLNLQSWPEVITIQLLKYTDTLLQR